MSSRFPPLDCREFKRILGSFGFASQPRKGTSHEQWTRDDARGFFKVTVDCPKAPFHDKLLSMMLAQAGISKKDFYARR